MQHGIVAGKLEQSKRNQGRCPIPRKHPGQNNVLGAKHIPAGKEYGQGEAGSVRLG